MLYYTVETYEKNVHFLKKTLDIGCREFKLKDSKELTDFNLNQRNLLGIFTSRFIVI